MAITLTDEQRAAVEDALVSQAIVACAGSGKTVSAVRRVAEIRRRMPQKRAYVALLSYSKVAVDTFRDEYRELTKSDAELSDRVVIATVDSFIATNVLLPHGPTYMKCECRPFLVTGGEAWLNGFKVNNGTYPVPIGKLGVSVDASGFTFADTSYQTAQPVAPNAARLIVDKLAKTGAYTHALARYWAIQVLMEQKRLLEILACRYPFILIDEAQDIGSMHGALVSMLRGAGVTVSLIGDPNQAIYEFADADGGFLRDFSTTAGVSPHSLTENRRSVTEIVAVASALSSTVSKAVREAPARKHGAYFMRYKPNEIDKLVDAFKAILNGHGYAEDNAAILCRANAWAETVTGGAAQTGRGATERLAQAAIFRDRGDIAKSFECVVEGVLKLLDSPPARLRGDILGSDVPTDLKPMRRLLWEFLKCTDTGLPESSLRAKPEWHPRLKGRLPNLFVAIESATRMKRSTTWKNNLTTTDLGDEPLVQRDLITDGGVLVRTRTVHKVKGEGIDAVLYVARKGDLDKMLAGTGTEDGRVGYVAVTRARDLLIVGIPAKTPDAIVADLKAKGFLEWS
ncbi:MAG: UvrD-helicase domain-containing protein [Gammaproteobacteria bacterium]